MSYYKLSPNQVSDCRQVIKVGYRQKAFNKALRDRYLRIFNTPSTPKALSFYIGLQIISNDIDDDFCTYLPKPISEYEKPSGLKELLSGEFIYPESLLPLSKRPSKSTKKLYSFQIEEDKLEQLRAKAEEDGRTVSGTLRMLVNRYLGQ